MDEHREALRSAGFAWVRSGFDGPEAAFEIARTLIERHAREVGSPSVCVVGDFVLPPEDSAPTRDFQTLHFDFGLPLDAKRARDLARYTALYIPATAGQVSASTRLVPLRALLSQRPWATRSSLIGRVVAYGRSHGAWDDRAGYVEGSLARLIDAAAGTSPILPSVKADPAFLCGLEFDSLTAELGFFASHGLSLDAVTVELPLRPRELLVFDNLTLAHGRRGARQPGELHQRVFGLRAVSPAAQLDVRERILDAFTGPSPSSSKSERSSVIGGV